MFKCGFAALPHGHFGLAVKDLHVVHIEQDLHFLAHAHLGARVHAGAEFLAAGEQVEENLVAHHFRHVDLARHGLPKDVGCLKLGVIDVVGANAKDDLFARGTLFSIDSGFFLGNLELERVGLAYSAQISGAN